jgi:epoxyqueuosine reductase
MKGKFDDWVFGCDVCQDVCPWNRFSKSHNEPLFHATPELLSLRKKDWEEITEDIFKNIFKNSAVKRTMLEGLKRNVAFSKK